MSHNNNIPCVPPPPESSPQSINILQRMVAALEHADVSYEEMVLFIEQHPETINEWISWKRQQNATLQVRVDTADQAKETIYLQELSLLKAHVKTYGVRIDQYTGGERKQLAIEFSLEQFDLLRSGGHIKAWDLMTAANLSRLITLTTTDGKSFEVALSMNGDLGVIL